MAIDYSGLKFPKGPTRRDEKLERLAEERTADTAARDWYPPFTEAA